MEETTRRRIRKAGTVAIWVFTIYWSISFCYSVFEVARHLVHGDDIAHVAAHALMAALYALGTVLGLSMLYPTRTCPSCQGWGSVYRPMAEAKLVECHRCQGSGKVLGKRSDL